MRREHGAHEMLVDAAQHPGGGGSGLDSGRASPAAVEDAEGMRLLERYRRSLRSYVLV